MGSWVCAPSRRRQGAPPARRCAWSWLGAHGDSTPATAEPQGYLRLPGGAAGLQTIGACLGVPAEDSFHLYPCPRSLRPGFSRSFIRSHLASGANLKQQEGIRVLVGQGKGWPKTN